MSSPRPLLFLGFEGVLVLQSLSKQESLAEALRAIGRGDAELEDYGDVLAGLFERHACDYLKAIHNEFRLTYCLTSEWTQLADKNTMAKLLRHCRLEFVANNLHPRWETGRSDPSSTRVDAIERWLKLNDATDLNWFVLDSEKKDANFSTFSEDRQSRTLRCFGDVGFTEFEFRELRQALKRIS